MYCQGCGWETENESALFCQKCGSKLTEGNVETDSASLMNTEEGQDSLQNNDEEIVRKQKGLSLLWPSFIPIASLVLASSFGYYYYNWQYRKE